VVFAYLDQPVMDEQLRTHTFCHAVPGKWHVMGAMLSAGGSLQWLRNTLCGEERAVAAQMGVDPYELMTAEAAEAPPGSESLLFLPYLTGERAPYPDPCARGVFFGLGLRHQKRHMIRAVLEGVAFGLRDCFDLIDGLGLEMPEVRASGGGARSLLWRQIQADVSGRAMSVINVDEGPAYGAGLLSSFGELGRFAQEAQLRPLDPDDMAARPYDPTRYQDVLYLVDSFEAMVDTVTPWLERHLAGRA
jgi:xylulokinase